MRSWPLRRGTSVTKTALNGVRVEVVTATGTPAVTVVHFHGGGYCVGSPAEARGLGGVPKRPGRVPDDSA